MVTIFSAFILGLVEGFTEFLPISSTAHLILTSHILGLGQSGFIKTFEIAIQSGAILAVIVFFWRKFLDIEILKRVIVAFIPTGIIGLIMYAFVKEHLLGNMTVVLLSLGIGGIALIVFERFSKRTDVPLDIRSLSYRKSTLIGVAQAVAIIPGVSRSAATIVGGLLLGVGREAIVEFSFLLAVPTILAATGLDLVQNIHAFSPDQFGVLSVGFAISFLAALISIKFLISFVQKHSFMAFGVYRIVLVAVFFLFFL